MRQLIAALAVIFLMTSCGKMKKPEFIGVENVKMGKMSQGKSEVVIGVKFYNPNKFDAHLKSAEGEAWIDSAYLGTYVVDEKILIPAKKEFVVPVKLSIGMKEFAKFALRFAGGDEIKQVHLKTTGTIRAGRNGFYKNIPVKYEGVQSIEKLIGDLMKKPSTN